MPGFTKGPGYRTPFGKNVPYRSTKGIRDESYTVARTTVPSVTVDGATTQVLQPGVVLAKITSGGQAGKVGPYTLETGVTDGRQTAANIVGVNKTFLPWQLLDRDVEVAAMQTGTFVQSKCFELNTSGATTALSNTTANSMRSTKTLDCLFV